MSPKLFIPYLRSRNQASPVYEYIKGQIQEVTPAYAVVETNGIGYHLHISLTTYEQIKNLKDVQLMTHSLSVKLQ